MWGKEKYLEYFGRMEDEHIKCALTQMAWDDVCWMVHHAVDDDKLFTLLELKELFPVLLKRVVVAEITKEEKP